MLLFIGVTNSTSDDKFFELLRLPWIVLFLNIELTTLLNGAEPEVECSLVDGAIGDKMSLNVLYLVRTFLFGVEVF